jgi:hypothetical protein
MLPPGKPYRSLISSSISGRHHTKHLAVTLFYTTLDPLFDSSETNPKMNGAVRSELVNNLIKAIAVKIQQQGREDTRKSNEENQVCRAIFYARPYLIGYISLYEHKLRGLMASRSLEDYQAQMDVRIRRIKLTLSNTGGNVFHSSKAEDTFPVILQSPIPVDYSAQTGRRESQRNGTKKDVATHRVMSITQY